MMRVSREEDFYRYLFFFLAVLSSIILLRVAFIHVRPLHHDEGVNFHFVQETIRKGYYPYSHENYHGPSYFYALYAFTMILGESVLSFRGSSILCGVLACILPFYALRASFRRTSDLVALLPAAFSSSLIFHSRYAIHEIMLLLFALGMAAYSYRYFDEKKVPLLGVATLFAAGCFATKETTLVVGFGLFLACLVFFGVKRVVCDLVIFFKEGGGWLLGGLLVVVLLFSGGLQWSNGVREFLLAFSQWISRGVEDTGHFKPWYYYLQVLMQTEPSLLPALCIPFFALFEKGRQLLGPRWKLSSFFAFFGISVLFIHSCIPYKMPWIVIQWTGPLCVALGIVLADWIRADWFTQDGNRPPKWLAITVRKTVVCALLFAQLVYGILFNFVYPYQKENPFSYVHTSPGFLEAMDELVHVMEGYPRGKLLVAVNSYWPLPYYLRQYAGTRLDYGSVKNFADSRGKYSLYLVEKDVGEKIEEDDCIQKKYYRLSDVEETFLVRDLCKLKEVGRLSHKGN